MKKKEFTISLISLIAGGLIGGVGIWFSQNCAANTDSKALMNVCRNLTVGDTQGLLGVTAIQMDEYYAARSAGEFDTTPADSYRSIILDGMDRAYSEFFEGKDIEVRQINPREIIVPQFDSADTAYGDIFMYEFLEDGKVFLTLQFEKVAVDTYELRETYEMNEDTALLHPSFVSGIVPMYTESIEYARSMVRSRFEQAKNGETPKSFSMGAIYRSGENVTQYTETVRNRAVSLYKQGWMCRDYHGYCSGYDTNSGYWTYTLCFEYENLHTGEFFLIKQKFDYQDGTLFVNKEYIPEISGTVDKKIADACSKIYS